MRPVAEIEARLGVRRRQAPEDLARVQPDAGERVADAVGRVQRDGHQHSKSVKSNTPSGAIADC